MSKMENAMPEPWSCPYVGKSLVIRYDGTYDCCSNRDLSKPVYDSLRVDQSSPDEYRQSQHYLKFLESAERGEWPKGCELCHNDEQIGLKSSRSEILGRVVEKELNINFGNLCNTDCVMCDSHWSTKIASRLLKHPNPEDVSTAAPVHTRVNRWKEPKTLEHILSEVAKVKRLRIIGGEPIIDPDTWQFLDMVKRKDLFVTFSTNLSRPLDAAKLDILNGFQDYYLSVSIDNVSSNYEWLRQGLKWNDLIRNLTLLKSHDVNFVIHAVAQAHTVRDMPALEKLAKTMKRDIRYHSIRLPSILGVENAPLWAIEESISQLIKDQSVTDGIQILEYARKNHDENGLARLTRYTDYLNSHRSQRFDCTLWTVCPN